MQLISAPPYSACVLLVDDDEVSRGVLAAFLKEEGIDVVEAADGMDALAAARRWHPVVIVLDLVMPRMNAWEFVTAYRREVADEAPIIVLSAMAREAERVAAETGAVEVLAKPVGLEHLVRVIRDYAGGRLEDEPGQRPEHARRRRLAGG